MKKTVVRVILIILCIAAAGGGLWYYLSPDEVEVVTPQRGSVSPMLKGTGKTEGERKITVYSDVSGVIKTRYVETGDRVEAGKLLFDYEGEGQSDQVELASNDVEYAKKVLSSVTDSRESYLGKVKDAEKRIENCKQVYALLEAGMLALKSDNNAKNYNIAQAKKQCESDIAKLEAQVAEKQSELAKIETDLKALELKGNPSDSEVERLRKEAKGYQDDIIELNGKISGVKRDEICLPVEDMDPATYAEYIKLENNLDTVMRLWTEAKNDKDTAQAMVTAYKEIYTDEQEVEKDRINLDHAMRELDRAKSGTAAPKEGIITSCLADAGAYVEKGAPVIEMQSSGSYKVNMLVSKYDIAYVREGQKAVIKIGNSLYNGQVAKINQTAESDASGKAKAGVEIAIDTGDDLIVGLEADVTLTLDPVSDVLTVPNDCIYTDDDGSFVYIVNDGEVEKLYIITGIKDSENTQVSGIAEDVSIVNDPDAANYLGEEVKEKTK